MIEPVSKRIFFMIALSSLLLLSFNSCNSPSKHYNKDLFIGSWREVHHNDKYFNDDYAIELKLNADSSFSLRIPSSSINLSGTWSLGGFDTTTIIALKYQYKVREIDVDYYGGTTFPMYYLIKVNKAVKDKLYLVTMSSEDPTNNIVEHLFKPAE